MKYLRNGVLWGIVFVFLYVLHSLLRAVPLTPFYVFVWFVLGGIFGLVTYVANTSSRCALSVFSRGFSLVIFALMLWAFYPLQSAFHLIVMLAVAFLAGASIQYFRFRRKSE